MMDKKMDGWIFERRAGQVSGWMIVGLMDAGQTN